MCPAGEADVTRDPTLPVPWDDLSSQRSDWFQKPRFPEAIIRFLTMILHSEKFQPGCSEVAVFSGVHQGQAIEYGLIALNFRLSTRYKGIKEWEQPASTPVTENPSGKRER